MICPHCEAALADSGNFCTSCGNALPSPAPTPARIVGRKDFAQTRPGRILQLDELKKLASSASHILGALAILQGTIGGIVLGLGLLTSNGSGAATLGLAALGAIVLVLCAIFTVLAIWAKYAPLPAAITGLVLYGSLVAVSVVSDPTQVPGLIIPILICIALGRAVSAGVRHRVLKKHLATI